MFLNIDKWFKARSKEPKDNDLVVVGEPTDKSILWGSPPHEFGGEIAERLSYFASLPHSTSSIPAQDSPSLEELVASVSAQPSLSLLRLLVEPLENVEGAAKRIVFSLRADCVRPDHYHVSQAGWNSARDLYEMDEWVEVSGRFFNNMGMWAEMSGRDIAVDRKELDATIWPEERISAWRQNEIASQAKTSIDGEDYFVIQMEPFQEPDQNVSAEVTLWVDATHSLLRKAEIRFVEDGQFMGAEIQAFSNYGASQVVEPPKWSNLDENDVIVRTDVCVVEHW